MLKNIRRGLILLMTVGTGLLIYAMMLSVSGDTFETGLASLGGILLLIGVILSAIIKSKFKY